MGVGVQEVKQDLKSSSLEPTMLPRRKTGETKTQGFKVMFMAFVSEGKPIGLWEMKKEDWTKCKHEDGGPAKGHWRGVLSPLHQGDQGGNEEDAGSGPIGIWLDKT